jgi:hypothetical protein
MMKDILYPPLETMGTNSTEESNILLSVKLKRCFETVQSIHKNQKHRKMNTQTKEHTNIDDRNLPKKQDLDHKKYQAAVFAAITAESEIKRLGQGIIELESILDENNSDDNVSIQRFPSLPCTVIEESDRTGPHSDV